MHGFEDLITRHHTAAGRVVDDDKDRGFSIAIIEVGDAVGGAIGRLRGDDAIQCNGAV